MLLYTVSSTWDTGCLFLCMFILTLNMFVDYFDIIIMVHFCVAFSGLGFSLALSGLRVWHLSFIVVFFA